MSSLERLGEAGWLPDVRSEESLPGQACNQPTQIDTGYMLSAKAVPDHAPSWIPSRAALAVASLMASP